MSTNTVSRDQIESRVADALEEFGADREQVTPTPASRTSTWTRSTWWSWPRSWRRTTACRSRART